MNRTARLSCVLVSLLLAVAPLSGAGADDDENDSVSRALGNDRFSAGDEVQLVDEIYGDAIAAGGEVTLDAKVRGDALVAGGRLTLRGSVDEDLYVAGGEVRLSGHVAGSARIAGGEIDIERDAVIDGGVSLAGGRVEVEGRLGQYLQVAGGSVRLNGEVGGDVEVAAGELEVGPATVIEGSLTYRGPKPPEVARDAQVRVRYIPEARSRWPAIAGTFALLWLAGWIVVGVVVMALAPGLARRVAATVQNRTGMSLLAGCAVLIGVPIAIFLLMITLVGIPLGLLALGLYLVLLPLGYLASAFAIGDWLLLRIRRGGEPAMRHRLLMLVAVLVGLFVLTRIPFIGGLIAILLVLAGIGSIVLAAVTGQRGTAPPAAA